MKDLKAGDSRVITLSLGKNGYVKDLMKGNGAKTKVRAYTHAVIPAGSTTPITFFRSSFWIILAGFLVFESIFAVIYTKVDSHWAVNLSLLLLCAPLFHLLHLLLMYTGFERGNTLFKKKKDDEYPREEY